MPLRAPMLTSCVVASSDVGAVALAACTPFTYKRNRFWVVSQTPTRCCQVLFAAMLDWATNAVPPAFLTKMRNLLPVMSQANCSPPLPVPLARIAPPSSSLGLPFTHASNEIFLPAANVRLPSSGISATSLPLSLFPWNSGAELVASNPVRKLPPMLSDGRGPATARLATAKPANAPSCGPASGAAASSARSATGLALSPSRQ